MELSDVLRPRDWHIFSLILDLLGRRVYFCESAIDEPIRDTSFADLFVAHKDYFPGEVRLVI